MESLSAREEISDEMVVIEEIIDKQADEKRQQYSDYHAELVSASNEFRA